MSSIFRYLFRFFEVFFKVLLDTKSPAGMPGQIFFYLTCLNLPARQRTLLKDERATSRSEFHFGGGVFVLTGGMVNEDIIGLLDFARSGAAERADGRGERKYPYRGTDRNAVERREVDIYRFDRHFPMVHTEAPAPPESQSAGGAFGRLNFVHDRARSVSRFVSLSFNVAHARKVHDEFFLA